MVSPGVNEINSKETRFQKIKLSNMMNPPDVIMN